MRSLLWRDSVLSRVLVVIVPLAVSAVIIIHGYDGEPFLRGDCPYYYWTALALLREHSFDLARELPGAAQTHAGQISLAVGGELVPKHPVVLPILSLPLIAMLRERGALAFNVVQLLALLGITYSLARTAAKTFAASAAVLLTFLTGPFPHYVWNYSPDICSTLLLVGAAAATVRAKDDRSIAAAGAVFGLACVAKFPLLVFAPGAFLLLPRRRAAIPFVAGFSIPAGIFALYNFALFGSPFVTSYDRIAVINAAGAWSTFSQRSSFDLPFVVGLRGQMFDPQHGLLFTSPLTLAAIAGIPAMKNKVPALTIYVVLGCAALICFFSTYDQWNASHYGNRFLFPVVALMSIPLAALLESVFKRMSLTFGRFAARTAIE